MSSSLLGLSDILPLPHCVSFRFFDVGFRGRPGWSGWCLMHRQELCDGVSGEFVVCSIVCKYATCSDSNNGDRNRNGALCHLSLVLVVQAPRVARLSSVRWHLRRTCLTLLVSWAPVVQDACCLGRRDLACTTCQTLVSKPAGVCGIQHVLATRDDIRKSS